MSEMQHTFRVERGNNGFRVLVNNMEWPEGFATREDAAHALRDIQARFAEHHAFMERNARIVAMLSPAAHPKEITPMESSKTELPPLPEPIWLFQMPGEPEWLEAKDAETAGFLFKQTGAEIMEVYPADQVRAAIREAVAAERERCARICDSYADVGYPGLRTGAAKWLAAAIRGATSPEGK